PEGLPRRLGRRDDVGDPERGPAGALADQPEPPPGPRAHRPPLPREEPRAAFLLRARSGLRSGGPFRDLRTSAGASPEGHSAGAAAPPTDRPRRDRGGARTPRRMADLEEAAGLVSRFSAAHVPARLYFLGAIQPRRARRRVLRELGRRRGLSDLLVQGGEPGRASPRAPDRGARCRDLRSAERR